MSGHSKWAQIKRSKGAKDAKRGILFSRLSKRITIAAKAGGSPDPNLNFQLRTEVENAKAEGMPLDNIERAAKKAFDKHAASLTEAVYEGYGPFGTAFLVEAATDNTNRAVQNIKRIFSKHHGSLGSIGSVSWQFENQGQILIEQSENLSELTLLAIDLGALDVQESSEGLAVATAPAALDQIKHQLAAKGANIIHAGIVKQPTQTVPLSAEQKTVVEKLLAELEDYEDVIAVYTNAQLA